MKQRDSFLASEGDRYFRRNPVLSEDLESLRERDPVLRALRETRLEPKRVLEIGAGNGWRLACMGEENPELACDGLEPSAEAVADGRERFGVVRLQQGTADDLPYAERSFDLVIFGFCLYLCDREDLFRIAQETDRVLDHRGHIAILDFFCESPRRTPYKHCEGVFSYKTDYARMFLWNPRYREVYRKTMPYGEGDSGDLLAVSIIQRVSDTC